MILTEEEVNIRLESPGNLINRMRAISNNSNAMSLFGVSKTSQSESRILPPSVEQLIDNAEGKIKLGVVQNSALEVLNQSLNELKLRLPEVDKVKDFSTIAKDMNAIITQVNESSRINNTEANQVIIYKPIINVESNYEVIHLSE